MKRTSRTSRPAKRKRAEHRRAPRVAAPLRVGLRRGRGMMRDVSASGIFFEADSPYSVGSVIEVRLDLDTPWGKVMVRSKGRIVRIEPRAGRVGVAVRFVDADADAGVPSARRQARRG
jgi:PilZ domain-containing protein